LHPDYDEIKAELNNARQELSDCKYNYLNQKSIIKEAKIAERDMLKQIE